MTKKMNIKNIIIAAVATSLLTGCGIYNKYKQDTPTPTDIFGSDENIKAVATKTSRLQQLIRL